MAGGPEGYNAHVGILQDGASGQRLPRLEAGIVALPPSKSQVLRALMVAAGARRKVTIAFDQGDGWAEAGSDRLWASTVRNSALLGGRVLNLRIKSSRPRRSKWGGEQRPELTAFLGMAA